MTIDIATAAAALDQAARSRIAIPQFPAGMDLDCAYAVQRALIDLRLARGERRIGMKMGFTSHAKMIQMGVSDMIWGRLTDAMCVEDGGTIALGDFVHPRVEPEVAFLLGRRLVGHVTEAEAFEAISAVAPALEIIDSRYQNFRFSLCDVVADNASSSALVVGPWTDRLVDMTNLAMAMSFDGQVIQQGSSAAILGDPLLSLVAAARLVAESGEVLEAGDIVLAGAATSAEALAPGVQVSLEAEQLGRVGFTVTGDHAHT